MADSTGHLPRHPSRILKATQWSLQGLRAAWLHESSFRLEVYLLAVMGQSGNAAGGYDHCHFEARATAAGKGLDPSQYAGCPNAVGVYGEAPGQADPGEKNEENADAAKKLQRISIGPVSRGDADAVYAVCVSRGLVAAGLYKSEWSV